MQLGQLRHAHNIANYVTLTLILCVTFTTLTFILRVLTKRFLVKQIDKEDCKHYLYPIPYHIPSPLTIPRC